MQITKFTHACIRIAHAGRSLVIDPGTWTEPQALLGADAVLITHEHYDHVDVLRLAGLGVTVYAPAAAHLRGVEWTRGIDLRRVDSGARFDAAGLSVHAVGSEHARVHGEQRPCANLGYVIEDRLYHPGDALYVPAEPVEVLCVPVQASWLKLAEAIDFVNAVRPERAVAIHDGQVNHRGLDGINHWLTTSTETDYRYLRAGESIR